MIVGRGLIGKALLKYDNDKTLFYVNGISNSRIKDSDIGVNNEIIDLKNLLNEHQNKTLVYFSTCMLNSINEFSNDYINHKNNVEMFIQQNFKNYLIVRTSNLVGNNPWNPNTLLNFLVNALLLNSEITINKQILRNILDVDDLTYLLNKYFVNVSEFNTIIDIVYPFTYTMEEIMFQIENSFKKSFSYKATDKDVFAHFNADLTLSHHLFKDSAALVNSNYLKALLHKYYSNLF